MLSINFKYSLYLCIKLTFLVFANLLRLVRYLFKISIGRGSYIKGWVMGGTKILYDEPWPVY